MQIFQRSDPSTQIVGEAAGIAQFASRVVSMLAERHSVTEGAPREALLNNLIEAALSGRPNHFEAVLTEMRQSRVSVAALADIDIPHAARKLGEDWMEDTISWMDVSIAVARLQSLLREIGLAWHADHSGDTGQGAVLMIIPDREQHTLGAMVAMAQMRRYGVSVCLRICPTLEELRSLVASRGFDGVMISVGLRENIDAVAKLVRQVKEMANPPLPVVIGGAITQSREDVAVCTGADLSTNDIGAALEVVGLKFNAFCILKRA